MHLPVESEDGDLVGLISPPSYEVSLVDGTVSLREDGERVADEYEHVSFGGGAHPQGERLWGDGPDHDSPAVVAPSS